MTVEVSFKAIIKDDFNPRYIRQVIGEYGDIWWDYGPHNAFYVLREVSM